MFKDEEVQAAFLHDQGTFVPGASRLTMTESGKVVKAAVVHAPSAMWWRVGELEPIVNYRARSMGEAV